MSMGIPSKLGSTSRISFIHKPGREFKVFDGPHEKTTEVKSQESPGTRAVKYREKTLSGKF